MLACATELLSFVVVGGAPAFITTAGKFDPNYSRGATRCRGSDTIRLLPFAATTEGWWRGTVVGNAGPFGGWNGTQVKLYDGAGNWPYAITLNSGIFYIAVHNGGGYTQVSTGIAHDPTMRHFCIHWKRDASVGFVDLYINDSLAASISGNTTLGSTGGIVTVEHRNVGNGSTASNEDFNWSECAASTNSLLGTRLATLAVSGAGGVNTFAAGGATEIDEAGIDTGDMATSDTAGQELEVALADLYAGLGPAIIPRSVALHAYARQGASGPTSLALGVNTNSSVDYGSDQAPGASFALVQRIMEVNPVTGVAWTTAEVNALAARIKSAA